MNDMQLEDEPTVEALVAAELPPSTIDLKLIALMETIADAQGYINVGTFWKRVKAEITARLEYFGPRKARANQVWKDWLAAEHAAVDELREAERKAARLLGDYELEQVRAAEVKQRALDAAAHASAVEKQFEAALLAADEGAVDVAAVLLEQGAVMTVTPPVRPDIPEVEGLGGATRWKAVVVDLNKLILEAADEIVKNHPRIAGSMLKADQVAVNRHATSMKALLVPLAGRLGLKVWEDRAPRRI